MKVFVTGGTGVLGRRAVPRLVAAGHDVTVLVRSPERAAAVAAVGAHPVTGSLFDPDGLRVAVVGHDAVVNLATHIPPATAAARPSAWAENDRIRTEGVANLVAAARAAGAGVYHVTADESPTRAAYARALDGALGDPGRVRPLPERIGRVMARSAPSLAWSQRITNRRFRAATGWAPAHGTAAAVLDAVMVGGREPRRLRSGWAAVGLLVLAFGSLFVGTWALAAPSSFHASFPGMGRVWVATDGPFNEHLIRDVGAFELALALVAVGAALSMTLALVRTAALAHLVAGVPHLAYHATHLDPFAAGDRVAQMVSLAVPVVVAATLLVATRRRARQGVPVAV